MPSTLNLAPYCAGCRSTCIVGVSLIASNSLWAAATLGIRDDAIIGSLVAACVAQSRKFNAQDAANSLWAAAKLGIRDGDTVIW